MKNRGWLRPLLARVMAFSALLLLGCSSRKVETWNYNGQKAGTLTTRKQAEGFDVEYRDLAKRVVRIEHRDVARNLKPGACITAFDYDPQGRVSEMRFLDNHEQLAIGPEGFAVRRWRYSSDAEYNVLIDEQFLDTKQTLVKTRDGFAALRHTQEPTGRLKRLEFFDPLGAPAPSLWLGVTNTVRVDYVYLEGVGEVLCAAFFDDTGRVLARKRLSGRVSTYAGYYTAPPPGPYAPAPGAYVAPPKPVAPPPGSPP